MKRRSFFSMLTAFFLPTVPAVALAAKETSTPSIFGDGRDGDLLVRSHITLTRDMYFRNVWYGGGHLDLHGFRLFVSEELDTRVLADEAHHMAAT